MTEAHHENDASNKRFFDLGSGRKWKRNPISNFFGDDDCFEETLWESPPDGSFYLLRTYYDFKQRPIPGSVTTFREVARKEAALWFIRNNQDVPDDLRPLVSSQVVGWGSSSDAQTADTSSGVEDGEKPAQGDESTPAIPSKRPSKKAFQAWFTRDVLGVGTQEEIAEKMTEEGIPATQGQVSKWLREVEEYRKAGGTMPEIEELDSLDTIDPAIIDVGARQDGRTRRQRQRRDDNAD